MVLAKVMDLVGNDKMELAEAMNKVTEDAMKEAQAAQAAQGAPAAPSAEAQMAAGAGALSGSPIPGASQGQQDLGSLLSTLRKPVMAVADRTGTTDRNGRPALMATRGGRRQGTPGKGYSTAPTWR